MILSVLLLAVLGSAPAALAADTCSDGVLDPNEECDPNCGTSEAPQACPLFENGDPASSSCTTGETCFRLYTCCKFNCQYVGTPGIPCSDGNDCTVNTVCNQVGQCVAGEPVAADTPCGDPSATECNLADTCDGARNCQPNFVAAGTTADTLCADGNDCTFNQCNGSGGCQNPGKPAGTPADTFCADANECTFDQCNGSGGCQHPGTPASTPCGDPADTECTDPDTCNGTGTCQANHAPAGTTAGTLCADANECTFDQCDGSGGCQNPGKPAGTPAETFCGDGIGCTFDECNGSGGCQNPPKPEGEECRAAVGACDVAEHCAGGVCPADVKVAADTACRPPAGACDVAESCDGVSGACPDDEFEPASTECRPSGGVCDPAESCTGGSAACPPDAKSTAECRPAVGECDAAESCDGVSVDCPPDAVAGAGVPCNDGDFCTNEACDGAGTCVPDQIEPVRPACQGGYKCYKTALLAPSFERQYPTLVDNEFGLAGQTVETTASVKRPRRFCNPADIAAEGIVEPDARIMCYKIKDDPNVVSQEVVVEDRFGVHRLGIRRADTLCLPGVLTEEGGTPVPDPPDVAEIEQSINHFKCYKVGRVPGAPTFEAVRVPVADAFEPAKETIIKKPKFLCTPVIRDAGAPPPDPLGHLTCYKIKDAVKSPFPKKEIVVMDGFAVGDPLRAVRGVGIKISYVCVRSFIHPDFPSPSAAFLETSDGLLR